MDGIHPGVTGRKPEPLLVRPRTAWIMLGCGNTHGYALLNAGELESFMDGRARKITVESIHRYIARRLASAGVKNADAQRRRRGRRRKVSTDVERRLDEQTGSGQP
jgi:hypothetical protein